MRFLHFEISDDYLKALDSGSPSDLEVRITRLFDLNQRYGRERVLDNISGIVSHTVRHV
jgi:hypothetical protein